MSRFQGNAEYYKGAAKENVGKIFGKKDWEAEGAARKAQGQTEAEAAKAQHYQEGMGDKTKGHAQNAAGSVTGNEEQRTRGLANKLGGEAKMQTN
ncbi:hypothetical protein EV182_008030, partial [Spiromyces aspiralis]